MLSNMSYLLLLPQYIETYGINEIIYGIAVATNFGMGLLVSIPSGHISDKIGRKSMIILGFSVSIIAPIILILFTDQFLLIISTGIMGLGTGLAYGVFSALIADTIKAKKLAQGYGGIHGISILGSAVGIFAIQHIIHISLTYEIGLRNAFILISIIQFSSAALALLITEVKTPIHEYGLFSIAQFSKTEKRVIRDYSLVQFVIGFGAAISVPYYALFFIQEFNSNAGEIGLIFTAGTISMAIATIIVGHIGDRVNKLRFLVIGTALAVPMAFGIILSTTMFFSATFYVLRTSIANMLWPIWLSFFMIHISKLNRGKALGVTTTCWNVAYIPGAVLGGYLMTKIGGWAFPIAAIMYLIVTFYVFFDLKKFGISK